MSFTLPWTVNKLVSTNINDANSISDATYGTSSLKVNGKTLLMGNTVVVGKLGVGGAVSSNALEVNGTLNATALQSVKITPTNRPQLSTNRYIGANSEVLNWDDPQNIIFNGNGTWTTYLPSVLSGTIARVGSRFTFGMTSPWTGTKTVQAQGTQYIYDGGTAVTSINVSLTSATQHYIELLCVNYSSGAICWAVVGKAYQYSIPATMTFNAGITASAVQTINFGTNNVTMGGANISGVVKNTGTENIAGNKTFTDPLTVTPTSSTITINNFGFATPAQSTNSFTTITAPYTAITNWSLSLVSGTAPSVYVGNGVTAMVNQFDYMFPEYPLFTQYLSFQNGAQTSVFSITQSLTFATTGSYLLTMYIWGEYNRYSTTQNVSVTCGNGSVSSFSTVEQGWSKLAMKFKITTAGANLLTILINSGSIDSGISISGIQIVSQSGFIVGDGGNTNNQLITPYGSYTSGTIYNTGTLFNYGAMKNFGPLALYLPYSSGSVVIGSSLYGSVNPNDQGKYNVLIGQSNVAGSTPLQASYVDGCVAIGYAALEQGGPSTGISRCVGVGYQANRWNQLNCDDNCALGYLAGQGLGYAGSNSARNCSYGTYVLAYGYGSSNDNAVYGYNSISSYSNSLGRSFNSCIGSSSLINCFSNYNSCIGYGSAANMLNTGSNYNTFVGAQVCPTQSGVGNVMTNCTFIGSASDVSVAGTYSNSTCIGYNSRITASSRIILGTSTETTYAMGGLNIPFNEILTILGTITANSLQVTPIQLGYLNALSAGIVSLSGAQTINDIKTFNSPPVMSGASITAGSIGQTQIANGYVTTSTMQTINGSKTFSVAPIMSGAFISASSIPSASIINSSFVALTGAQTVAGIKTFSSPPVMSGASITAGTIGQSQVANGYMDLSTDQTVYGIKTYDEAPVMSGASIASASINPDSLLYIYIDGSTTNNNSSFAAAFTGGTDNTAIGIDCMGGILSTGSENTACGRGCLQFITGGSYNSGYGVAALSSITTGSRNCAYGNLSGYRTNGSDNSFYGNQSGSNLVLLNYCSALGSTSNFDSSMNYSTAIGYGAVCTASNQIKIGRSTETTRIEGALESASLTLIGKSKIDSVVSSTGNYAWAFGDPNHVIFSGTAGTKFLTLPNPTTAGIGTIVSFSSTTAGSIVVETAAFSGFNIIDNVNAVVTTITLSPTIEYVSFMCVSTGANAWRWLNGQLPNTNIVATVASVQTFTAQKTFSVAPIMSGASISAASIPDTALSSNVPLDNTDNTFTGLNAVNNQYVHKAYGSVITTTSTLTTLSPIIYEHYSVSATTAYTITLPTVTASNVGQKIVFRRVGGTTTIAISFTANGTQLIYGIGITGSTTNALMSSGTYTIRLVGLLVTGSTYGYFQI
jgi:hypothetical protein